VQTDRRKIISGDSLKNFNFVPGLHQDFYAALKLALNQCNRNNLITINIMKKAEVSSIELKWFKKINYVGIKFPTVFMLQSSWLC